MEKFTEEIINQIDTNNARAGAILKSIIKIVDDENKEINIAGIDILTLIETAADLIARNDETFSSCK